MLADQKSRRPPGEIPRFFRNFTCNLLLSVLDCIDYTQTWRVFHA
jgi:hypothetical protein